MFCVLFVFFYTKWVCCLFLFLCCSWMIGFYVGFIRRTRAVRSQRQVFQLQAKNKAMIHRLHLTWTTCWTRRFLKLMTVSSLCHVWIPSRTFKMMRSSISRIWVLGISTGPALLGSTRCLNSRLKTKLINLRLRGLRITTVMTFMSLLSHSFATWMKRFRVDSEQTRGCFSRTRTCWLRTTLTR